MLSLLLSLQEAGADQAAADPAPNEAALGAANAAGPLSGALLWIGFGFLCFMLIFLVVAWCLSFLVDRPMRHGTYQILRVICSLCAGFAGGMLTGGALLKFNSAVPGGGQLAIDAAAGFAAFFGVWLTFARFRPDPPADPYAGVNGHSISISGDLTFRDVCEIIAGDDSSVADLQGFEESELDAPLTEKKLTTDSPIETLKLLGSCVARGHSVRPYSVSRPDRGRILIKVN